MRNIIAHGYFDADLEVPWKTVLLDLPPLREHMRGLLESASVQKTDEISAMVSTRLMPMLVECAPVVS
jgi:hypothetical protein